MTRHWDGVLSDWEYHTDDNSGIEHFKCYDPALDAYILSACRRLHWRGTLIPRAIVLGYEFLIALINGYYDGVPVDTL